MLTTIAPYHPRYFRILTRACWGKLLLRLLCCVAWRLLCEACQVGLTRLLEVEDLWWSCMAKEVTTLFSKYMFAFFVLRFWFPLLFSKWCPRLLRWRRAPPLFRRFPSGWLGAGPLPVGPEIRRFRPVGRKARGANKSFKNFLLPQG